MNRSAAEPQQNPPQRHGGTEKHGEKSQISAVVAREIGFMRALENSKAHHKEHSLAEPQPNRPQRAPRKQRPQSKIKIKIKIEPQRARRNTKERQLPEKFDSSEPHCCSDAAKEKICVKRGETQGYLSIDEAQLE